MRRAASWSGKSMDSCFVTLHKITCVCERENERERERVYVCVCGQRSSALYTDVTNLPLTLSGGCRSFTLYLGEFWLINWKWVKHVHVFVLSKRTTTKKTTLKLKWIHTKENYLRFLSFWTKMNQKMKTKSRSFHLCSPSWSKVHNHWSLGSGCLAATWCHI